MKTITIGEIKQGLNTKCHIKLLLSFKGFFKWNLQKRITLLEAYRLFFSCLQASYY